LTKHTILFLAANPIGTDRLALDEEARAIRVALERSGHREDFQLETRWAARPLDLLDELRKLKPTVVHFSGHGGRSEPRAGASPRRDIVAEPGAVDGDHQHGLYFQGPDGRPQLVSAAALEETFGAAGASVKLVVLSACYSEVQAEALRAHVDCVVGVGGSIRDEAARNFAIGFYGGLGERQSVVAAYKQGCAAISLQGLPDSDRPHLKVRDGIDAAQLALASLHAVTGNAPHGPDDASGRNVRGKQGQIATPPTDTQPDAIGCSNDADASSNGSTKTGSSIFDIKNRWLKHSLGLPSRRTLLFVVLGAATLGAGSHIYNTVKLSPSNWKKERQLLADAISLLSSNLGSEQNANGAFESYALLNSANAYDTAQELSGLMAAARTGRGIFDEERRERGLKALEQLSLGWNRTKANAPLSKAYEDFSVHKATEPSPTAGVAWGIIAASLYVEINGRSNAQRLIYRLLNILTDRQLDDGSFEYACDPVNHGHPNAYSTCMAVWALFEIERAKLATDVTRLMRQRGTAWLTRSYLSPSTTDTVAISSIRGLAEQVFWVIEQSRHIDARSRTNSEEMIAISVAKQLIKDCDLSTSGTRRRCSPRRGFAARWYRGAFRPR
jgi:hypothetical protein